MYAISASPMIIEDEGTMATQEERLMILGMVEDGKISAEEGARLLQALGVEADTQVQLAATGAARYLRIRVTDLVTGTQKVSVNIPLSVVLFVLRFVPDSFGVNIAPETDKIDKETIQAAIESGLSGCIIDVRDDEDGQHVEVFLD